MVEPCIYALILNDESEEKARMFTSLDKAIAAAIMAAAYIVYSLTGIDIGISEATAGSFAMVISTALVWLVPNKT